MTTAQAPMSQQQHEQRQKREEEQRRQLQQQYEAFQRRQQQQQQQPHSQDASGAPTKASLKAWWNHFTFAQKIRKETEEKKDLAVIFRPALIAHPSHELSPQEHQLSQDVLEFLIAHQDWFMLDIPPPPTTKPTDSAVTVPMAEAGDLLSSSDEELGGWKLISKVDVPQKIGRRRTTTERSGEKSPTLAGEAERLSPVVETPPSRSGSIVTVTRSRTLPSSKGRPTEEERHAKLVKKAKRASAQPARRTPSGGTTTG
ncbi:hypothetical protein TRAPUB_8457 [Trametes pubescens]|uniref:Rho-GAP domain-containing protein n=1 Tax=Trametes pubescens TaxID=154538 RepID=A0A1M2W565_TRAPU|nr:hypothetical protein TRAPUB_8457 [Trametes pubescens]